MARAAATSKPAKIFVFIYLIGSSAFVPTNAHWIKTLYHSILLNSVRRGSRAKFRMFKDSSEIGMKPRLAQTVSDYHPSAPSFSAIRKLAFFGGRGDPLKKRILTHHAPLRSSPQKPRRSSSVCRRPPFPCPNHQPQRAGKRLRHRESRWQSDLPSNARLDAHLV